MAALNPALCAFRILLSKLHLPLSINANGDSRPSPETALFLSEEQPSDGSAL